MVSLQINGEDIKSRLEGLIAKLDDFVAGPLPSALTAGLTQLEWISILMPYLYSNCS
jgi:hypothetical protein